MAAEPHHTLTPVVYFALDDPDAVEPTYGTPGAACMDLFSCEDGEIPAGEQRLVDTGVIFAIPKRWEGKIRSKSGLASKNEIVVPTGTIDSDYRGRVKVLLRNLGKDSFKFTKKMKVAQMKIGWAPRAGFIKCAKAEDLPKTRRGAGGFGSTGLEKYESDVPVSTHALARFSSKNMTPVFGEHIPAVVAEVVETERRYITVPPKLRYQKDLPKETDGDQTNERRELSLEPKDTSIVQPVVEKPPVNPLANEEKSL